MDCVKWFGGENVWIWIKISLECVPKVRINNIPSLVQIMAWRRIGDKPLSEPMMLNLLTHICVTRPQRVNESALFYIMAWRRTGRKPLSEPMMTWIPDAYMRHLAVFPFIMYTQWSGVGLVMELCKVPSLYEWNCVFCVIFPWKVQS